MNEEMTRCVETCLSCYKTCLSTAMNHCLEAGGKHVEPAHFRLMMACAEMCRTSAHFMLINSPHHKHTCKECAEICAECARDCRRVGDMEQCVTACEACAASCRAMAAGKPSCLIVVVAVPYNLVCDPAAGPVAEVIVQASIDQRRQEKEGADKID